MVKLCLSYVCKKKWHTCECIMHFQPRMTYIFQGFDVSVLGRKRPSADPAFTFFTFVCVRSCKSECGVLVGGNMKEKPLHLWPVLQKPAKAPDRWKRDELSVAHVWELGRERGRTVDPSERSPSGWNSSRSSLSHLIRENMDFRWTPSEGIPPFLCSFFSGNFNLLNPDQCWAA